MCGQFLLKSPLVELQQAFRFAERPNLAPRYNIAPTQTVPIVRRQKDGQGRELALVRWGLVPFWATDLAIGNRMINARAEGIAAKRPSHGMGGTAAHRSAPPQLPSALMLSLRRTTPDHEKSHPG